MRYQTIQWEAPVGTSFRAAGIGVAALVLSACAQAGGLGSILGGVLGNNNSNQVTGTVQRVDTRYHQINITQSNGQAVSINYDNQTRVVYRNQDYSVGSLEYGDQVTARIQQTQNGAYYTDYVQVDSPASGSVVSGNSQVQTLQGVVRNIDVSNGWFQIDASSNVLLTISMPYNANASDTQRFRSLRIGDAVRFAGVFLNNSRVELRQFY